MLHTRITDSFVILKGNLRIFFLNILSLAIKRRKKRSNLFHKFLYAWGNALHSIVGRGRSTDSDESFTTKFIFLSEIIIYFLYVSLQLLKGFYQKDLCSQLYDTEPRNTE